MCCPHDVPQLQQALAEAGFTGLGACGDTLRNITLCPGNGLTEESVDLRAVGRGCAAGAYGFFSHIQPAPEIQNKLFSLPQSLRPALYQ